MLILIVFKVSSVNQPTLLMSTVRRIWKSKFFEKIIVAETKTTEMWRKRKTSFLGKEIPSWQTALRVAWQSHPGVMATCTSFNFALQKCSIILPNPFHPTLVCLTLPYTLLPYTTLPYPILSYPP